MQLATYLFFATDCEAALAFYADCGLGRVVELVRYGEGGAPATGPLHGKILHACFEGPGVRFYASDNADAEPMRGFANFVMLDDHVQTRRLFDRMAQAGRITTPLGPQPWGDYYGKLTDRFGVQWMFNSGG